VKVKTCYTCANCGYEAPKWLGKCPACQEWNTFEETTQVKETAARSVAAARKASPPELLEEISGSDEIRFSTGMSELDRVLGSGAVQGSLVLIGGEPGIGKSTLLLQICQALCKNRKVLYVTGEESKFQIKMRAKRLHVTTDQLYILSESDIDTVISEVQTTAPDVLIVDSIQTVYRTSSSNIPGNVAQVKECTMLLMQLAKNSGITVFVVGHVNKEGALAGPKVLEHMVDCVLYFEGERHIAYRVLRAAKNRYGSTNEIGVFEMRDTGLLEVPNPSAALLDGRPIGVPGTCVACVMEGSRPLLAEIQALVSKTMFGNPRRMTSGVDYNRSSLLLAVLEKRANLLLGMCDSYINVIGGFRIDEPAADLSIALALASSFLDKPIPSTFAAIGEIGLTGELRAVSFLEQRLNEIVRMGFTDCLIPKQSLTHCKCPEGLTLHQIKDVKQAIALLLQ